MSDEARIEAAAAAGWAVYAEFNQTSYDGSVLAWEELDEAARVRWRRRFAAGLVAADAVDPVERLTVQRDALVSLVNHHAAESTTRGEQAGRMAKDMARLTAERDRLRAEVQQVRSGWQQTEDDYDVTVKQADGYRADRDRLQALLDPDNEAAVERLARALYASYGATRNMLAALREAVS